MILRGTILDKTTGLAIPGASVVIVSSNGTYAGIGSAANAAGEFFLNTGTFSDGYFLQVSSIGYQTVRDMLYEDYNIDWDGRILLQRMSKDLPPVVVTSNKKDLSWLLLLLAIPLLADKGKTKSVGTIKNSQLLTVALGAGILLSWGLIKKLLCMTGLYPGDCSGAGHEATDPKSVWKPTWWQQIPDGVQRLLIQESFAQDWIHRIRNAFTVFQDNYSEIANVFAKLKTKSQVSYLAYKFQERYGDDLLSFLEDGGGVLPWDGLSEAHLKTLIDLVNKLPKYMP